MKTDFLVNKFKILAYCFSNNYKTIGDFFEKNIEKKGKKALTD